MKRLLVPALLLLGISLAAQNIESRVVFTMAPGEEIYTGEDFVAMYAEKDKYCCILRNAATAQFTLIWNGNRIVTAPFVSVCYYDLDDFDNCVYKWAENVSTGVYRWYIKTCEGVFGPYDDILYVPDVYPFNLCSRTGLLPYMPGWLYRECFMFTQYGQTFVYRNGGIIKLGSKTVWEYISDISLSCMSPSGKHYAMIKGGILGYDGKEYPFELPEGAKQVFAQPLDNGLVYVSYNLDGESHIIMLEPSSEGGFNAITLQDAYFDFRTTETVASPYNEYHSFLRGSLPPRYDITDKTGNHVMTVDTEGGFIFVDGDSLGSHVPLFAAYQERANAFVWVEVEGSEVIRYAYKLL